MYKYISCFAKYFNKFHATRFGTLANFQSNRKQIKFKFLKFHKFFWSPQNDLFGILMVLKA